MPLWGLVYGLRSWQGICCSHGCVLVTHQSQLPSGPSTLQSADVPQGSPALSGSRDTAPGATVSSEYISLHSYKYKTEMKLQRNFTVWLKICGYTGSIVRVNEQGSGWFSKSSCLRKGRVTMIVKQHFLFLFVYVPMITKADLKLSAYFQPC